eukprot:GHRR01006252.1.p1 GENE.GHRR01006252.1~~GHRR01006252.1.p1  ORF type:complete len:148 (+),score=34.96 GHRR01006252.1:574-1017(+)
MLALLGRRAAQCALPLAAAAAAGPRHISYSVPTGNLRDFLDNAIDKQNGAHGRAWLAKELRNKSWDDLHKLWYVCLKERNMLLTQMNWEESKARKSQRQNDMGEMYTKRYRHVKLTMNRIKQVLSERACHEADAVKAADMKRVIHYM